MVLAHKTHNIIFCEQNNEIKIRWHTILITVMRNAPDGIMMLKHWNFTLKKWRDDSAFQDVDTYFITRMYVNRSGADGRLISKSDVVRGSGERDLTQNWHLNLLFNVDTIFGYKLYLTRTVSSEKIWTQL